MPADIFTEVPPPTTIIHPEQEKVVASSDNMSLSLSESSAENKSPKSKPFNAIHLSPATDVDDDLKANNNDSNENALFSERKSSEVKQSHEEHSRTDCDGSDHHNIVSSTSKDRNDDDDDDDDGGEDGGSAQGGDVTFSGDDKSQHSNNDESNQSDVSSSR